MSEDCIFWHLHHTELTSKKFISKEILSTREKQHAQNNLCIISLVRLVWVLLETVVGIEIFSENLLEYESLAQLNSQTLLKLWCNTQDSMFYYKVQSKSSETVPTGALHNNVHVAGARQFL